jgi:hypothetical protein
MHDIRSDVSCQCVCKDDPSEMVLDVSENYTAGFCLDIAQMPALHMLRR